jgi:hypothetical protein
MSNLRLINEITITTSQSSTNITDVFTSDFDIYKITLQDLSTVGTTDVDINVRFINSGGSVDTTGTYHYAVLQLKSGSSFTENKSTSLSRIDRITFSDQSPESQGSVMYVYNPFNSSSFTFIQWQESHSRGGGGGGFKGIGCHRELASITGVQFFDVNGDRPYNSGKIRVYGLRVDT